MDVSKYDYEDKAIINNEHIVNFEFEEYYSMCDCPYCEDGYLKPYWNYCPLCGTKVEIEEYIEDEQEE